jgi:hypothetical protein
MDRAKQLKMIQKEAHKLFVKKNRDYGDAFALYGPIGVVVRIGDKINRLVHLSKNKVQLVDDESTRDTLIDLHNYAAMAIMLLDECDSEKEMNEKEISDDEDSDASPIDLQRALQFLSMAREAI